MPIVLEKLNDNLPQIEDIPNMLGDPLFMEKMQKTCDTLQSFLVAENKNSATKNRNNAKINEAIALFGNQNAIFRGEFDSNYVQDDGTVGYAMGDSVSMQIGEEQQMFFSIENANTTTPPSPKWVQVSYTSIVVSTPMIVGSSVVVSGIEANFFISATALLPTIEISKYEIDWGDGVRDSAIVSDVAHTYTGDIDDIFVLSVFAVDGLGNRSYIETHTVSVVDAYIDVPTFSVEGATDKVPQNADVTIDALPTAVGCTIDTIEMEIVEIAGSLQSTTDLTTPIVFESPDLEVLTTYTWRVRGRDTANSVDGAWGSVIADTKLSFSTVDTLDILEDGSGIELYNFNDTLTSLGGTTGSIIVAGASTYSTGKWGNCLSEGNIFATGIGTITGDYTVSMWFMKTASMSVEKAILSFMSVSNTPHIKIMVKDTSISFVSVDGGGYTHTITVNNNEWYHVLVSVGSTTDCYINGAKVGSYSATNSSRTQGNYVNRYYTDYNGQDSTLTKSEQFRFLNRKVTDSEAFENYNEERA